MSLVSFADSNLCFSLHSNKRAAGMRLDIIQLVSSAPKRVDLAEDVWRSGIAAYSFASYFML
jgi:hypothetical protein